MGRPYDPARRMRERLLRLERREAMRTEVREVAEGVAETVALSEGRGEAFDAPAGRQAARPAPYRRRSGLEWLAAKGRISPAQFKAGQLYGAAFRRAARDHALASSLALAPGGVGAAGPALSEVLVQAEATARARRRLSDYRARLLEQPDLVAACDLVCGQEKTPREAAGGERAAGRLEAVLGVALDLLAGGAGRE